MRILLAVVLALAHSHDAFAAETLIQPGSQAKPDHADRMTLVTGAGKWVPAVVAYCSDGNGVISPCAASAGSSGSAALNGRSSASFFTHDYTATPVTSGAYQEIASSTSSVINQLNVFDSSGEALYFAVGSSGSEVNQFIIVPGGNGDVDLHIPAGSRLSIKAVSTSAATGLTFVNALQ